MRAPPTTDAAPKVVVTAASFLFGAAATAELARRLDETGVMATVADCLQTQSASLMQGAREEVVSMVEDFLDLDVATVILNGWRKHKELLEAAEKTRGHPRSVVVVPLGKRDLSLVQRPRIELVIGDVAIPVITFEVRIDVDAIDICGVVRQGALVKLKAGTCKVGVSLKTADVCIAQVKRSFPPHLAIQLGDGIPLGLPSQRIHGENATRRP